MDNLDVNGIDDIPNKQSSKKENRNLVVILIISIIIILIQLVVIVCLVLNNDNNAKKLGDDVQQDISDKKTDETSQDIIDINNNLVYIEQFLNYRSGEGNILDVPERTIELIEVMFMNDCNMVHDNQGCSLEYDKFKNKFNELYGDNYNFEEIYSKVLDLKSPFLIHECSSNFNLQGNNLCWNRTWGSSDNNFKMKLLNITKENDKYIVIGSYVISHNASEIDDQTGNFEIQYIIKNNKKYLSSIVLDSLEK